MAAPPVTDRPLSEDDGAPADKTIRARIPRHGTSADLAAIMEREFNPDQLRAQGYKWFRLTAPEDDPTHAYMECWWEKPTKEGNLNRQTVQP